MFQPLEYRSANCCIPIPVMPHQVNPGSLLPEPPSDVDPPPTFCWPIEPDPPVVRITTPSTIWHIDKDLNMPEIEFQVDFTNMETPTSGVEYTWELDLHFRKGSRSYTNTVSGTTTSESWSPDWGTLLAGANHLELSVTASIGNDLTSSATRSGYQIHGQNPTRAQILEIAYRLEHRGIAWRESYHIQFENMQPYEGINLPLFNSPHGWGIMQLADKRWRNDENILWSWEHNLQEGVDYFELLYDNAHWWLGRYYDMADKNDDPDDDWDWNPDVDTDNVIDDAIARYGSGKTIYSPLGNNGMRNCGLNLYGCEYLGLVRGHMERKPWNNY